MASPRARVLKQAGKNTEKPRTTASMSPPPLSSSPRTGQNLPVESSTAAGELLVRSVRLWVRQQRVWAPRKGN
jgi:hypothetical protein